MQPLTLFFNIYAHRLCAGGYHLLLDKNLDGKLTEHKIKHLPIMVKKIKSSCTNTSSSVLLKRNFQKVPCIKAYEVLLLTDGSDIIIINDCSTRGVLHVRESSAVDTAILPCDM